MTTTPRTMGTRALRMLGADPEEVPTATQMSTMLEALNAMLHGWKGQGVDIGHSDFALDDDMSVELDPKFNEGTTALLAIVLDPEYPSFSVSPPVAIMAQQGWAALQAAYFDSSIDSDLVVDTGFQRLSANRRRGFW